MRIVSILTAVAVAAALYGLVIERDTVLGFARSTFGNNADEGPAIQTEGPQPEAVQELVEQRAPESTAERPISVIAMNSEASPIENGITIRGQTEAMRFVEVRSQVSGIVINEPLRKGAFVQKGQTLCQTDPGPTEANLAEARARLEEARLNERTATQLAEDGFASETRRNSALAALQSAEAAYKRAEDAISRLTKTAPFEGLLETDTAELGSLLQPGSLCARIVQLDPIKFVGYASEIEVERIEVGNTSLIRFFSGRTAVGNVTFVSRSADPTTRTFQLEITIDNKDLSIRDGAAAQAFIATERENAHLIPQSALTLNDEGILGVKAAIDNKAKFFAVDILRETANGVWVTGLPDVADVIIVGQEFVIDGSPVTLTFGEIAL